VSPERIVLNMNFADEQGRFVPAKNVSADVDWPDRTTVTVTFLETNGRTTMTLHQTVREAVAKRTGAYPSWLEMLDRLSEVIQEEGPH
jgi:uncharacterized protein YndB with AHSA1/START domain